ncbi:hypothetical protein [Rhodococcus sp. Q]|uniref:hypothetical protein n=1 Tax=Rhodococcus sp. Q TaxID=2502252 RepID=UPI001484FCB6|nr:hypothetical protein [Rhodococcus sp. Q]
MTEHANAADADATFRGSGSRSGVAEVMGRWAVYTVGDVEHGPPIDHVAPLTCT